MRRLYLDKNLQFVFAVTLMAVLGVSSIIPALPDIMDGLGFTPATIGLTIAVFTLPGVLLAPAVGILADRLGRKVVLVPSLFIFGGFGFACFFAESITQLLVLRFCQGVGAAPLGVLYGTIIGDLYSGRERAQAMGYNSSVLSMGTAGFPALGGFLALLGWNWPFLLPLLAIPLGLAISMTMDSPEPPDYRQLQAISFRRAGPDEDTAGAFPVRHHPAHLRHPLRPHRHLPAAPARPPFPRLARDHRHDLSHRLGVLGSGLVPARQAG